MATYRLAATVIKRSEGRSATAAAAYRSAMVITDERTGLAHDYRRKSGVLHSEIMLPEGAPAWMADRAQLWNAVEAAERRKDAQLAREVLLSLPHELDDDQRRELVRAYAAEQFTRHGMIADVAIHAPDRQGDNRNHHAHVMLTLRSLTGDGFGKKDRSWNDTARLEGWRESWAAAQNRALERAGQNARVDHRSNTAQGIDREPEPKQGPQATAMERQGRPSLAGADRRAVQARNAAQAAREAQLAALRAEIAKERETIEREAKEAAARAASEEKARTAQEQATAAMLEQLRDAQRSRGVLGRVVARFTGKAAEEQRQQDEARDRAAMLEAQRQRMAEQMEQLRRKQDQKRRDLEERLARAERRRDVERPPAPANDRTTAGPDFDAAARQAERDRLAERFRQARTQGRSRERDHDREP